MTKNYTKSEVIVARITDPVKEKTRKAAALQGISASAFIVLHSLTAANKIIKNSQEFIMIEFMIFIWVIGWGFTLGFLDMLNEYDISINRDSYP